MINLKSQISNLNSEISYLKYLIIVLAMMMVAWLLPAFYELVLPRTDKTPFVVYSCLDSTFIKMEVRDKQVHYIDFRGREFTKSEADSLLPLFAFRQLVAEERLPDSLFGVALTPKLIQQNNFHFKTSPKQLNKPAVGLYTLLESASGRVDLVLPPDVFRLTDEGLEFVDCETILSTEPNRSLSHANSRNTDLYSPYNSSGATPLRASRTITVSSLPIATTVFSNSRWSRAHLGYGRS